MALPFEIFARSRPLLLVLCKHSLQGTAEENPSAKELQIPFQMYFHPPSSPPLHASSLQWYLVTKGEPAAPPGANFHQPFPNASHSSSQLSLTVLQQTQSNGGQPRRVIKQLAPAWSSPCFNFHLAEQGGS